MDTAGSVWKHTTHVHTRHLTKCWIEFFKELLLGDVKVMGRSVFLHNDEQKKDREKGKSHMQRNANSIQKTIIWHSLKKTGVVFTCVLLGGYALTQVRTIHILLTSVSQVHHVSIVVVGALEWLSGVTTMSQHAHKKGTGCHGNQVCPWHRVMQ